jgi:hypothetical protein
VGRNSTLTVHHKRYKGKPWEVADNDLQTLCERCHDAIGPHQRGGAFYEWFLEDEWRLRLVFEKCPLCGCDEDESHSGVVAFACGHFFTADLPHAGLCFQWQSSHGCGFPYLVLA